MKILIKDGKVIDPANKIEKKADILIEGSLISKVAPDIKVSPDRIINAAGMVVIPGLVDMHVHLRQPGREDKETVLSGTNAALHGGVTSLLSMPNTDLCMDTPDNIKVLKEIIRKDAKAEVFICGAITMGRKGKELTDIALLKKEGILAISDDGSSVDSDELMQEALNIAKKNKILVICHCEDRNLSAAGVVNLGLTSTRMGLKGISKESEYQRIRRDIALAQKTGGCIHIAHVSCQESVEIIAAAKKNGVAVSAETAPHYFSLSQERVLGYDANMKINPPLRTKSDLLAIKQGLKDGTIDVIASDHAPHIESEKEIEFDRAEFGTIGLETELAVSITELIHTGLIGWTELVEKLSLNPARILGIEKGTLSDGSSADIVLVSAEKEWTVKKEHFLSQSKNCAFLGCKLKGVVEHVICAGKMQSY